MKTSLPPLACTGARLRRLTRRVTVFYEQYLRSVGLRLTQYSLLAHLELEPQPLQVLAEKLEMDRTTLTRGIKPLVAAGWIVQTPGADARQRLLALSPEGVELRARAREVWARAQGELEAVMDRDFVAELNLNLDAALLRLKPALPEDN
ncbi:MarR family winged helix-turn-helix transcriptional regulator [Denitromonas ohlonensis]|uniref:MarR family winged helix-turn-helix transcriptional regulator n=1 Tax=Denitromonas ohlonensis TaxID=3078508 RepID=UPI001642D4FF|nr:MarR family winged helix-turn-helix transcriptional regulator [Denitromonas ohlonensis]